MVVIVMNAMAMCISTQYESFDNARSIYGTPSAADTWPGARDVFQGLEWFFGVFFTVELVGKVLVLRRQWLRDRWNYFDAIVVLAWYVDVLAHSDLINPTVLRISRFYRVFRLLRLLRHLAVFRPLQLIIS